MKKVCLIIFVILYCISTHAQEKYFLTSDSVKLYINVKGKGIPCLYLHGGPGAGSYFLEKLVGDSLEKHFTMIYLDQRGSGRSSSPKNKNYSMQRMIKDFEEVRKSLGIEQWLTIGHSFGGLLQMGYIHQHPEVIRGMLMINCTLCIKESFHNSWFPKACEFLDIKKKDRSFYFKEKYPMKTRLDSLVSQLIHKGIIWKIAFASIDDAINMNKECSAVPRGNTDFENVAFDINDYYTDFLKESVNIKVPVLYFYGTKDWCVNPNHYKSVKFPNMILWKTGFEHMTPFIGQNREELIKAINCYIKKYKLTL
jgi:proline iminopeptidase